jgi:prepilin-type N-terminal cleavage/methylation domain-containing protein
MQVSSESTRFGRAFTMLEMLVVIVILGLIAAVVAPRVMRSQDREAEAAVSRLADLFSAAARRDEFGSQAIALSIDKERSRVELWSRTSESGGRSKWKADPLTPAVDVSALEITGVTSGLRELNPDEWWFEFPQTSLRPSLTVTARSLRSTKTWTLELPAGASQATLAEASNLRARDQIGVIDLDATGKEDVAW